MKITEIYLKKLIKASLFKILQENMLQMGKDFFGSKERKAEVEKEHQRKIKITYKNLIKNMQKMIRNGDLNPAISAAVEKSDNNLLYAAYMYHFKEKYNVIHQKEKIPGSVALKEEFFNYVSKNGRERLLRFLDSLINKIGPGLENIRGRLANEQFIRVMKNYKKQFYNVIETIKEDLEAQISLSYKSIIYIENFENKYNEQGYAWDAPYDSDKRATIKEFDNLEKAKYWKYLASKKFEEKVISIAKDEYIEYNLISVLKEILESQTSGLKISKKDDTTAQARVDKRNYSEVLKNNPGWFIVHYINAFTEKDYQDVFPGVLSWINYFGGKRSKDEFAGVAYHEDNKYLGDNIGRGTGTRDKLPRVGAVLKGHVTAIYDGDVGSTVFSQSNPYGGARKESGFVRYAGDMGKYSDQRGRLIIDLENYKKSVQGKDFLYNEGFIDNWQPTGIIANWELIKKSYIDNASLFYPKLRVKQKPEIVKELSNILLEIPLACQEKSMKIFDQNFNEINSKDFTAIMKDMINKIADNLSIN